MFRIVIGVMFHLHITQRTGLHAARKPLNICFYKSIGSYQGVTLYGNAYTDAYGAFGRVPCVRNQAWVRCPPRVYNPNAHSLRLP
ncbi:unnamed protein product, partial [Iphiclides podalirius]